MLNTAHYYSLIGVALISIGNVKTASAQNAVEYKSLVAVVEAVGESQVAKQAFVELSATAAGRQLFRSLGYEPDANGLFGANMSAQDRGLAIIGVQKLRESYLSKFGNDPKQVTNLRGVLNTVQVNAPRQWKFKLDTGVLKPSDPLVICKVAGCKVEVDAIPVYKLGVPVAGVATCVAGSIDCSRHFEQFASKLIGSAHNAPLDSSPANTLPSSSAAANSAIP